MLPGFTPIPCLICGIEHRDDCSNRFPHVVSGLCVCDGGCVECDWVGAWTTGGHRSFRRLRSAD
jgi:hypothetical protein